MPALRVVSWNVRSLRDSPAEVAAVLRALAPDIVCVQEAPRFLGWRRRCHALAEAAGLRLVTGGRPAGAVLLLASAELPVVGKEDLLLSKDPGLHQRGLAAAVVRPPGAGPLAVASTHLDLDAAARLRHAAEVRRALTRLGVPTVLGADVNEPPGSPAWALLAAAGPAAHTAATFPAAHPDRRIDAMFVDPALTVLAARAVGPAELSAVLTASDHRPLVVDLEVAALSGW